MVATLLSTATSYATNTGTTRNVTVNAMPVGSVAVIATNALMTSGSNPTGVTSLTGNSLGLQDLTFSYNVAVSCNANIHNTSISVVPITSAITAGTAVLTLRSSTNESATVITCWSGVTLPVETHSLATITNNISSGNYGNGLAASTTATSATTTANSLVIGALGYYGTVRHPIPSDGSTWITTAQSGTGTADRSITVQYRIDSTIGTKSSAMTMYAPGTLIEGAIPRRFLLQYWAACLVTLPIAAASPHLGYVIVDGVKKNVASQSVIINDVKHAVTSATVIVNDTKKQLS